MLRWSPAIAAISVLVATTASAASLDLTPLHRGLQFNFGNPGARSLGMGGAFIGRADDASAAEANPAGLTVISQPEITLEGRQLNYEQDVPLGVQGTASASVERVENSSSTPTFLSFAFPAGNSALAAYYHRSLHYEQNESFSQPAGAIGTISGQQFFFGDAPGDFSLQYEASVVGVAGAWRMGGLSVGVAGRYTRLEPTSTFAVFDVALVNGSPQTVSTAPTTFGRIDGSDSQVSYSAGLKWATASENLSIGAVYKSGSEFEVRECNPSNATERCSSSNGAATSTFEIPSQIGGGISIRPLPGVTLNADVIRIQYDSLLRNFEPGAFCAVGNCRSAEALGFEIDNATEIHIGGEWAFPGSALPFAIRAGWWRDPAHSVEYHGPTNDPNALIALAQRYSAQGYQAQSTQNHVAFGLGYLGRTFELNAAYDRSSLTRTVSVSALVRF